MSLPRILCGGPTRETTSLVFQAHRAGLEAQADNANCPCTSNKWHDGTGKLVPDWFPGARCRTCESERLPKFDLAIRHEVVPDPGGHRWQQEKIERVAKVRQEFLEQGAAWGRWVEGQSDGSTDGEPDFYDALLMVDSDVVLGPGVLSRMMAARASVVFGVYWTYSDWGNSMDHWPQVWDVHPYRFTPDCWAALKAPGVNEVPVLGGGACTLIRGRGFESRYWPLLKSLTHAGGIWPGEDRTYCLGLEARGIPMVAVTGLPIHHCYTMADSTAPALERIRAKVGLETPQERERRFDRGKREIEARIRAGEP